MSYITVAGTAYRVRVGEGRGARKQIENRRRALDGGLLVDTRAIKREVRVEFTGIASADGFLTPAQGDALMDVLLAGNVAITGTPGTFTARARDVEYVDGSEWKASGPVTYRWVSCVLDEI